MSSFSRRRTVLLPLVALAVAALAPIADAKPPRQMVRGEVLVATGPYRAGSAVVGACGLAGTILDYAARLGSPTVYYQFKVSSHTRGKRFTLLTGSPSDVDIAFTGSSTKYYAGDALGGESGTVPRGAREAVVCLVTGAPTAFTYTAG